MEQRTPIPLRRISVATTSLRARTTPLALTVRRQVVRVLGSSKARGSLLADGQSGAISGQDRNHPYVRSRRAASGNYLSVMPPTLCYATHSCSLMVHSENAGNEGISDHASRMSQVIPTPASLRGASCFGCNQPPAVPVLDRKARNAAMFRPRFNSPRKPPRTKRRL
jgi:hypothetical protein